MYQSFIGLEVHIHLLTKTKVFCGCRSAFGDEPNSNVCPVCLGYPGVLPSLNIEALRMGCTVARSLNCRIPEQTWFERKQYFYPDMPKNYQISQFASPLGQGGFMDIEGKDREGKPFRRRLGIRECHLEEDAGKMIHTGSASLLDYNRAGVSLLEIVTQPDMETGEEAEVFIQQLRRLVRYLGVSDGNMEEGSLRADANVSINLPGKGLGKKVEIKNLNSSRFVRLGLNYEIGRQGVLLDEGKPVIQETRLWNENRDQTEPMRQKENAQDYRYFPEPDLPIFRPDAAFLQSVEAALVEPPLERMKRLQGEFRLSAEQADLICEEKPLADYFEAAVEAAAARGLGRGEAAFRIANWLLSDLRALIHREGIPLGLLLESRLPPGRLAVLAGLLEKGQVSGKNARQALEEAARSGADPEALIRERGWALLRDPALIGEKARGVFEAERGVFEEAGLLQREGNLKRAKALRAYLVGKVIAASGGRADPVMAGAEVDRLMGGG